MIDSHLANLALHVGAGGVGILIGFVLLARTKGTRTHRRWGRIFVGCGLAVIATSAIGLIAFRFMPLFAALAVLVFYQLVGGWRAARTRERGPQLFDLAWTVLAAAGTALLTPLLLESYRGPPVVLYSTLGGLGFLMSYDLVRWLFPRAWFGALWRYEHSYKLVSAIFAMLSAFVGNVVRWGQPWSQMLPSAAGIATILFLFVRLYRDGRATRMRADPA